MSTAIAPSLPRLSRNEAQARTTLAQRAAGLPVRLGGSAWQARLTPLAAIDLLPEPAYTVRLEWAGAAFALRLPAAALEVALSTLLDGATLPELPPTVAAAVLEAGLTDALEALQALGRGTPQVLGWNPPEAEDPAPLPPHALALWLTAGDGSSNALTGSLHADSLGLLLAAGLVAKRPPASGPLGEDVPLRLRAEIGYTRLPADLATSLDRGDVVLMDACWAVPDRALWLSADGRSGVHVHWPEPASGAAQPPQLTVLHPWTDTMPASSASPSDTPAETTATPESLPVRLSFDLGELSLTLAQLRSLQPGQTLDLGHPLAGAVRIRANGALVGEGDLVDIDGQVGVSVRHLFANTR